MELDAAPEKPPREMTDDELKGMLWKTEQQLRELGVETELTEDDIAQARVRRLANGDR